MDDQDQEAEEQQADHVNQSDDDGVTPSQQGPVSISSNHLEPGAIQGLNLFNSSVNNSEIHIHGAESIEHELSTFKTDIAVEQKKQGDTAL